MSVSICFKCRYLREVDIDGYIRCDKGVTGKLKTYCREFEREHNNVEKVLRMLEKGEISLSLAAEIIGISTEEIIEEAIKRNIKIFDVEGDIENLTSQPQKDEERKGGEKSYE